VHLGIRVVAIPSATHVTVGGGTCLNDWCGGVPVPISIGIYKPRRSKLNVVVDLAVAIVVDSIAGLNSPRAIQRPGVIAVEVVVDVALRTTAGLSAVVAITVAIAVPISIPSRRFKRVLSIHLTVAVIVEQIAHLSRVGVH